METEDSRRQIERQTETETQKKFEKCREIEG